MLRKWTLEAFSIVPYISVCGGLVLARNGPFTLMQLFFHGMFHAVVAGRWGTTTAKMGNLSKVFARTNKDELSRPPIVERARRELGD